MIMSARREEYRIPDGTFRSHRDNAIIVSSARLLEALHMYETPIPLSYFFGTALHESGFAENERDTEPDGFQSFGIFQLSREECYRVRSTADPLVLADATEVFVELSGTRRDMIRHLLGLPSRVPDPPDLPAYLTIAHNQGNEACSKTIRDYGLDWQRYKQRNRTECSQAIALSAGVPDRLVAKASAWWEKVFQYGDDVLLPSPLILGSGDE